MALQLSIAGLGLEATHLLESGGGVVVLGRDAECTVCLPDPERNISRRHLSLWNESDALHFNVLSVVNGVELDGIEVPPGGHGTMLPGQTLALSSYRLTVAEAASALAPARAAAGPAVADPWDEFEREAAKLVAAVSTAPSAPEPEDDPFGDWGFQSTFGPDALADAVRTAGVQATDDLGAFFLGLGQLPPASGKYTHAELQAMGRVTRIALEGLLQAMHAAGGSRQAVRAEDRTLLDAPQVNPLRMDTPVESKLWYLFGGEAAAAGCIPPERAVTELVADLVAHQTAMAEAARLAVQGAIQDFDPESLKEGLLGGRTGLFSSARAWDAFARDYAARSEDLPGWVRRIMDRHFAEAYAQAVLRVKRHTDAPTGG
jgi:predicted component of type VI protein secretion system